MQIKFQYLTDVEGNLPFFKQQIRQSEIVRFVNDREDSIAFISNNPNEFFVFGGDVCDRGDDITVTEMLIKLKEAYPHRVILIVGNRDANKTRFCTELPLEPDENLEVDPDAVVSPEGTSKSYRDFLSSVNNHNTPVNRLKWILTCTMGAPGAFEFRRKELMRLNNTMDVNDETVYRSFRQSVEPQGFMRKYLSLAQIGAIIGDSLIVHGGVSATNIGKVPNGFLAFERPPQATNAQYSLTPSDMLTYDNPHEWIVQLNRWYQAAIDRWINTKPQIKCYQYSNSVPASPLQHIAIARGSYYSGQLPVVSSFLKDGVRPWPVTEDVAHFLQIAGLNRILAGHQPNSGMPLVLFGNLNTPLDAHSLQVFTCDTLYGNKDAYDPAIGAQIRATDPRGSSFASVHVVWDGKNNSSFVDIKGVDGFAIPYQTIVHFPRGINEDHYIGRVLQIEGEFYTVRINKSGNPQKPYVLTHTATDFSITYRHADIDELHELEGHNAFITTSTLTESPKLVY